MPFGVWNWGQGEIGVASAAHNVMVQGAAERLKEECAKVHGHGVVGVRIGVEVRNHHIDVDLVGTAVRPVDGGSTPALPFVSDLSARDFTLLKAAGWMPVGLAFGASFVYAPRRTAGVAMKQKTQNVELTNFTEAMYAARESAMERMQRSALEVGGHGVVGVKVTEGPMSFARHAVGFTAGTAVKLVAGCPQEHRAPSDSPARRCRGDVFAAQTCGESEHRHGLVGGARRYETLDGRLRRPLRSGRPILRSGDTADH